MSRLYQTAPVSTAFRPLLSVWCKSAAVAAFLVMGPVASAQVTLSSSTATSFPGTNIGASAPVQNVMLQVTSMERISGITVPVSQGGKQEYVVGKITGCAVDGTTNNATGAVCIVTVTFRPAYPGQRPAPLEVVTSNGNVQFGLNGLGNGPLAAFAPGILSTVAGTGTPGYFNDVPAAGYPIYSAAGGATDSAGNFYFADTQGQAVLEIAYATGNLSRVAGTGLAGFSGDGGAATSATLNGPAEVAIDSAGNLYIADTNNHRVRKVDATTGNITTVAGNGTAGATGDGGAATSAGTVPSGIAVDSAGNIYIAETSNATIRKVTVSTGVITTVAGNGTDGDPVNGAKATATSLGYPSSVAVDGAGNLYIADGDNDFVLKVTVATGIITIVAGDGGGGDGGPALQAALNDPTSVRLDAAGDIYIADYLDNVVRKISAATGVITTIAGNRRQVYATDGVATSVSIAPKYVALDSAGNLYIGDGRTPRLYEVASDTSTLNFPTATLVGDADTGDNPKTVTVEDIGNSALTLSAPSYDSNPSISPGWSRDATSTCPELTTASAAATVSAGGSCTVALDFAPLSASVTTGTLDLTDNSLNVTATLQTVKLTGIGVSQLPTATTVTSSLNPAAQEVAVSFTATVAYTTGTAIPTGTVQFNADGVAVGSPVALNAGVAVSAPVSTLSAGDHNITAIFTPSAPTTVASSTGALDQTILATMAGISLTSPASSLSFPTTAVAATSPAQNITFKTSAALSISAITVPLSQGGTQEYTVGTVTGCVADGKTINPSGAVCTVPVTFRPAYPGLRSVPLEIVSSTGNVNFGLNGIGSGPLAILFPGTLLSAGGDGSYQSSGDGGQATHGSVGYPAGGATDYAGNFYFIDFHADTVRKIDATTHILTTVAGNGTSGSSGDGGLATHAEFQQLSEIAVDSAGNLYIADGGNSNVRKVTAATGVITTVAGDGKAGNTGDGGLAVNAEISYPNGVVVDAAGNLYVSDSGSAVVRKITASSGVITTIAGNGTQGSTGDGGQATSAELTLPEGLALDLQGNLYIADDSAYVVRKVNLASGIISTVAGTGVEGYNGDGGLATAAELAEPDYVRLDAAGDLYIGDTEADAIRKVSAATGIITTVAGGGSLFAVAGFGSPATLVDTPNAGLALDAAGNLWISDQDDSYILQVSASEAILNYPTVTPVGMLDTTDGPQTLFLANIGNSALTVPTPSSGTNPSISSSWIFDSASTCPQLTKASPPYTLASSASCAIALDYKPTAANQNNGTLKVTDNSLNLDTSVQAATLIGGSGSDSGTYYTITTMLSSQSPSSFGQSIYFLAKVTSGPSGGEYFSGVLQFTIDGVAFGAPINYAYSGVVSSPTISTLSVGKHVVAVTFTAAINSGNPIPFNNSSASITQVVVAPHVAGTAPDTFVVTRNDDPDTVSVPLQDGVFVSLGTAANCVNQTAGAPYQTGGTDNSLCSFRDAIAAAGGTTGAVITFAPSVASKANPGTITTDPDISLFAPMTIQGPGSTALTLTGGSSLLIEIAGLTTIEGLTILRADDVPIENELGDTALNDVTVLDQNDSVAFDIGSGTVTNCSFISDDGNSTDVTALYARGTSLVISNSLFSAIGGHAIEAESATVSIDKSVFDANNTFNDGFKTDPDGAAVLLDSGAGGTITNSTFTNNTAAHGGAIYLTDAGSLTIANSTFSGNSSVSNAIIENAGTGTLKIRNTTIYGNTDVNGGSPIASSTAPTVTNTIIAGENGLVAGGLCTGCVSGGTNLIGVDPQLGPLGNYSPVPQFPALATYVPLPGSPAVCKGSAATDTTDELGYPRPNGSCYDIGAVQTAFALAFSVQPSSTPVGSNITPAPAVQLTERGVPISGETIQLRDSLGSNALAGTAAESTGGDGAATFAAIAPKMTGYQTLTATFGVLTATSDSFDVISTTQSTPMVSLTINPALQTYGTAVPTGALVATATYNGATVAGAFIYRALPSAGGSAITVTPGTTVLSAGTYTLTAAFTPSDTSTYTSASSSASAPNYTVSNAAATVTLSNLSATYDGNPHAATVTTNPSGLSTSITYNGSATAPTAAGSYPVVATITSPNYTGTATGTLIISKGTATVALSNLAATYDGTPHAVTVTTTPSGLSTSVTYDGSATAPTAAGSYTVVAKVTDSNYSGSASGTLVISNNTQTATVTLSNLSATYDGKVHAATATTIPVGLNVSLTYNGSISAPIAAGSYAVVATVTASGYSGSAKGTLVIAKASATVTLSNLSATYDGNPHAVVITTNPTGLSTSIAYNGGATEPKAAGSYAVVAMVTNPNYTGSVSGTLVIAKATASVTLSNLSATYNGNPHAATAATTPAGLAVAITYDGSTSAPSATGSYAVVATVTDTNYTGSATGTLLISANSVQPATVKLSNLSATYDGTAHAAVATTTPAGLAVTITYNGSSTAPVGVGSYAVVATITDPNYTGSASGTLVIAKANATVTLSALSAIYDGNPHGATAVTTPAGLAVTITYAGAATSPTTAGTYAVVATVNDANYTGSATGSLAIAKAAASVVLSNLNATYDGTSHAATAVTTPAGLAVTVTYTGSTTAPTAAGSYAVVATVSDANYSGSATGSLIIAKAAASITLGNLTAAYDGNPHAATAITTPAGLAVTITYAGSTTTPAAVGSYAVVATIVDANYSASATGTLVITAPTPSFDFAATGTTAMTVVPGSSVAYGFTVTPTGTGTTEPVSFTVTGLPVGAAATFTPSSIATLSGPASVTMNLQTSLTTADGRKPNNRGGTWPPITLAALLLPLLLRRRLRTRIGPRCLIAFLLMLGAAATLTGCGSSNGFVPLQNRTYRLSVTASSGAVQHSVPVTLNIQ